MSDKISKSEIDRFYRELGDKKPPNFFEPDTFCEFSGDQLQLIAIGLCAAVQRIDAMLEDYRDHITEAIPLSIEDLANRLRSKSKCPWSPLVEDD